MKIVYNYIRGGYMKGGGSCQWWWWGGGGVSGVLHNYTPENIETFSYVSCYSFCPP